MKLNIQPCQHNFVKTDHTLPDNLATRVPARELIQLTREAVQTFFWGTRTASPPPAVEVLCDPRAMLTLLTFSYATGLFESEHIAACCAADDHLRQLCLGGGFGPERIRLFRGQNAELVKRCLAFVIRHACERRRLAGPPAAPAPAAGASAANTGSPGLQSMMLGQREAGRRFDLAVRSDARA